MNRVVTAGALAFGFLCASVFAAPARAQEEGTDKITKTDKTTQSGTITSEDLLGCNVTISGTKANITLRWKDIKSVDYFGSPEFKRAKGQVDAGSSNEAIPLLEELRKKAELRAILKPHVLNLLGSAYMREGQFDKAIEVYSDLFKQFPKCQFLVTGGGENLINAYLAKNATKDAQTALDALYAGMKSVGGDTTPLNMLRGRVQEATPDFSGAAGSYKIVLDASTSDDGMKAAAELGIARCFAGQRKLTEAEAKYRLLIPRTELPALVLAGAWNGLGDIAFANGKAKQDGEAITVALYDYLRGCVQYTPLSGEPTTEYERAIRGAADCFKAISEIESKDAKRAALFRARAQERLEYLQTKFPNSPYLPGK